jgi:uncharacterized surface protein with fasciclin (FAS1) repeats
VRFAFWRTVNVLDWLSIGTMPLGNALHEPLAGLTLASRHTHLGCAFKRTIFRTGIIMEAAQTATPSAAARTGPRDIVDIAIAASNFTTLVAALEAADLVTTLKGAGPFTVFAPTDDAFNKLPAGTVEQLLKDKAKLAGILSYHVITTRLLSKDVRSTDNTTLQGTTIKVVSANGGVNVNEGRVTKADVEAVNGLIHAIDTVLMPK